MNQASNSRSNVSDKVKRLAGLAMLTAIVIVFQLVGNLIKVGTLSVSLVLIPIVVGAALYGPLAGMWLGFAFSAVVMLSGDANAFLALDPAGTVITIFARGICTGAATGLVYQALKKKNRYVALVLAAIVCPLVNTGLYLLGCRVFFWDALTAVAGEAGYASAFMYVVFFQAGLNFVLELALNCVVSPAIVRVIELLRKRKA